MVTRNGRVRVADVGLNARMRQLRGASGIDHWQFKSPEELGNPNCNITTAMDTYSFAVTVYTVCANHVRLSIVVNHLLMIF
jgi:hypothetical protein